MKKALEPVASFTLGRGKSRQYYGTAISRQGDGLKVNGCPAAAMVSFNRSHGVGGSFRVFAALREDTVAIFEGDTIGPGMITEQQVRDAAVL